MRLSKNSLLRLSVIFCVVFISTETKCQERFTDNLKLSAHCQYGYVLPEYDYFLYLANAPMRSVSLNFSKTTLGKTDFERLYNYPEYGISFIYSTLGNDDIFGRELAIVPYYHLKIVSRNRFNLYNELGFGLAYVTKVFDFENNYRNIAVGSHFNLHFNLKFGVNYRLYEKIIVNAGLCFDHFSNANTENPNIGINYGSAFAGVGYLLGRETPKQTGALTPHKREVNYELIGSFGAKRTRGVLESGWFYTGSLTIETKWSWLRALRLGGGIDVFFDPSAKTEIERQNRTDYQPSDNLRSGIHFSQEFVYSKLSLILQEGFYLGLTDQVDHEPMYNRGIIRVQVGQHTFVQLSMKSHLVVLDYPELGFGMKWK